MSGLRRPRESAFAYLAGLAMSALVIGSGSALALWFRAHPGAPPPIVVVVDAPPVSTTPAVSTTRTVTTTPRIAVPPEPIPPQVPDAAAYTAASKPRPGFVSTSANQYGWFSGDGVSARCDEWNRATVVGSTAATLFVVCESYFKAYQLAAGTPIRLGISYRDGTWSGAGTGVRVELTQSALIIVRDNGEPDVQAVVTWWTP